MAALSPPPVGSEERILPAATRRSSDLYMALAVTRTRRTHESARAGGRAGGGGGWVRGWGVRLFVRGYRRRATQVLAIGETEIEVASPEESGAGLDRRFPST